MLTMISSIFGVVITILLIVGVHELGHFLVARLAGIKVLRFSIGFGKKLYAWHDKKGTEYVIAAIPLGGYVKMLGEEQETVGTSEKHHTFYYQPFYKKIAVILAGPLFNLLFAFLIYWGLFITGFVSIAPVIGTIKPNSIAAQAGLKPQQEITHIAHNEMRNWLMIIIELLSHAGENDNLSIQTKNINNAQTNTLTLKLADWRLNNLKPDPLDSIGIVPYEPTIPATIKQLATDSPAEKSGLKVGDTILSVSGNPINDWPSLMKKVVDSPNQTLTFKVKRNNKTFELPITIGYKYDLFFLKYGFLGISPDFTWPAKLIRHNQYGVVAAIPYAWEDVVIFTKMNFLVLGKILTGKISIQSLGGPITIFESAGTALNHGVLAFFGFLAFLSISIGIINLVPIPGLDGGHLLFQLIQLVTRRPLSERVQVLLTQFGFIFLFLLMIQALVNDILRL